MIKRIGVVVLLTVLLLTGTVYGFSDIKETDWFYKDINGLKENGVISGYTDGTFRPASDITNAEALTMILRAANIKIEPNSTGHWGTGALLKGVENGVVEDTISFYFDDKASRGSVAEYVVKALKIEESKKATSFIDTNNTYAVTLYEEGIIAGVLLDGQRYYQPEKPITRAEIGTIVSRIMKYQSNEEVHITEEDKKEQEDIVIEEVKVVEEVKTEVEEIQEIKTIEVKEKVQLVAPLSKSEYDITNAKFHTKEDFMKLFVNMGYNNLTTKTIKVYGKNAADIQKEEFKSIVQLAFKEVFGKYPEYYSFANGTGYSGKVYADHVELTFTMRNAYLTDAEILEYRGKFIKEVDKKLIELIETDYITTDMTQKEKAKALFDWVVKNTKYDYNFAGISYTGYGQIANGTAVCQGYTATYNLMLKRLGIETHGIVGQAGMSGALEEHIWTIAYLDGQRYHIDTTWGDSYGTTTGKVDYNYFATNGAALSKTHTWERSRFGD